MANPNPNLFIRNTYYIEFKVLVFVLYSIYSIIRQKQVIKAFTHRNGITQFMPSTITITEPKIYWRTAPSQRLQFTILLQLVRSAAFSATNFQKVYLA